jgi:general secretion pathway protein D
MRSFLILRSVVTLPLVAVLALGQGVVRRPSVIAATEEPKQQAPAAPATAQPGAAQPGAAQPAPKTAAAQPDNRLTDNGGFLLNNVSLIDLIDILAKRLKINYILDPRVKGTVTIYSYGEVRPVDLMPLLQTVLRVNAATIVKVGEMYRVVPLSAVAPLPMQPQINAESKTLPDDERMILNMVFLKYATTAEVAKLITPFLGEGATMSTYEPANLLVLLDNSRNMKRTMDLLALFDSDTFAGQRVRLFEVSNGRPSELAKELETVFKAYSLSEKNSAVKFLPVDRINTLIAVAPNPGIFVEVDKWLKKFDIPVKSPVGAVSNYVYRLKYGRAETIAMAIMALYSGNPMAMMAMMSMMSAATNSSLSGSTGTSNSLATGTTGITGGLTGGYGTMGMMSMMGGYGTGYGASSYGISNQSVAGTATGTNAQAGSGATGSQDMTGSFLGNQQGGSGGQSSRMPRVVPNPMDNTLLVQGTPQEWEQITHLLQQLDVAPRQVLIDAKIYEVVLDGAYAAGVTAYLQKKTDSGTATDGASRTLTATSSAGLNLTAGALVLNNHELLTLLTASETSKRTKVISAPSIIATDSIAASINVGTDVPVLTSTAASSATSSGSTLYNQTVSNRSSGVTLNILARVNSSGIVTMVINQQVSTPIAPDAKSTIQSYSFQQRTVQTQVTVQDGDTVAIAGIILENDLHSSAGIPLLHKIPFFGAAFGAHSTSKSRTELIIFLTPRVIYDSNQITDATDELKSKVKRLQRMIKDE